MALLATSATFAGFADKSPAQLRELIVPEDWDDFDRQYAEALAAAKNMLSLDELEEFLAYWRRRAFTQDEMGWAAWREMLTDADRRLAGGAPPAGRVSMEEMKARIAARLAGV